MMSGRLTLVSLWFALLTGTIVVAAPVTPTLVSPVDSATGLSVTPTLQWSVSAGATAYRLQVASDTTFVTLVFDDSTLAGTSWLVGPLANGATFFWRVSARDGSGQSAFSSARRFTTIVAPPGAPVLLSPESGSGNVPTTATLTWAATPGAASYRLQVSTDSPFSTTVFDDSTLTGTSQQVSGLQNDRIYYWRLRAKNAGGQSVYSQVWNFTTIVASPATPVLVAPLSAVINQPVIQTLKWRRANYAATYRVQIATDSPFQDLVVNDSTIADTTIVTPALAHDTQYFWRVQSINAGGISTFSPVWNYATTIDTPHQVSPANNIVNTPVAMSFVWRGVTGATTYRLQIGNDSLFASVAFNDSTITDTTRAVTGLTNNKRYFWRVRAKNVNGSGFYSFVRAFNTIVAAPSATTLLYPTNNLAGLVLAPSLRWRTTATAAGYDLEVAKDAAFATMVLNDTTISDTTYGLSGLDTLTSYYWHVRAKNIGGTGPWSGTFRFTTKGSPGPLTQLYPSSNGTNIPPSLTLTWRRSTDQQVTTYWFDLTPDTSTFAGLLRDTSMVDSFRTVNGLPNLTPYYWRVRAKNEIGWGAFTAWRKFTTVIAIPPTPIQSAPANGAVNRPFPDTLYWAAATGASTYRVQVSTDSLFGTIVYENGFVNTTSIRVTAVTSTTRYFWHVNATNVGGTSAYSDVWSFTTSVASPALASPTNNAINQSVTTTLTWGAVPAAAFYQVQVDTLSSFASPFIVDSLTTTSTDIGPLLNYKRHYWRVRAGNAAGWGQFSPSYNFTTMLPTPVAASPASGSLNQPVPLTVSWVATPGASQHVIQMGTDSTFVTRLPDLTVTGTSRSITGLANHTRYFWRLQAKASSTISLYSPAWDFTTVIGVPALVSPAHNATNLAVPVDLSWNAVDGAASYRVQVSTDSLFGTAVYDNPAVTQTSQTVAGIEYSRRYFWKITAKDSGGVTVPSVVRAFNTRLSAPVALTPADADLNVALPATFSWNPVTTATSYRLQVSQDSAFITNAFDQTMTATSKVIATLGNNTRYFWRVLASNSGSTSDYSPVRVFVTSLATPVYASPPDGSVNQPANETLSWNATPGAAGYALQVALDSAFSTVSFSMDSLVTTFAAVGGLMNNTKYFWRAAAWNANGGSGYASAWNFTTILATPQLVLPLPGAINQAVPVTVSWNPVTGATRYRVQVATDSLFGTLVIDDPSVTATSKVVGGLGNNITYYWRVQAANTVGNSLYSAVRSFSTTLSTPTLSTPPDGAINQPVSVTLAWTPVAGASAYQVQVAADSLFGLIMIDDDSVQTTSRTIGPLVNNFRYYWRVRGVTTEGSAPYSAIASFTTILGTPDPVAPSANATNVSLAPLIGWGNVTGATAYRLQISTDSLFSSYVFNDSTNATTSRQVGPLLNNTRYYWRVQAKNVSGTGLFCQKQSFMTILATPVLALPAQGTVNQSLPVTVSWNLTPGASSYGLQVGVDSFFVTTVVDDSLVLPSRELTSLQNNATYFWRVRATNAWGESPYSSIRQFGTSVATPAQNSPANGSSSQPTNLTLQWGAVSGANVYRVQLSTDSNFTAFVVNDSTISSPSRAVSGLQNNATYYWRVRAKGSGGWGGSSTTWSFTTIVIPPGAPVLSSPAHREANADTLVTLRWRNAAGATSYHLVVALDSTFNNPILVDSSLTDTVRQIGPLAYRKNYYWKVRAANVAGSGVFSQTWRFAVRLATPQLISPANELGGTPVTMTLAWTSVPGAQSYHVQVARDTLFTTTVVNDSGVTLSAVDIGPLLNGRTYYWRVRARDSLGVGLFTGNRTFTVILEIPTTPVPVGPLSGTAQMPVTPVLRWAMVNSAESYQLQVSTRPQFDAIVVDDSTITDTLSQIGPLEYLTQYYWRVRSINYRALSTFSPVWSFMTVKRPPTVPDLESPPSGASDQPIFIALRWAKSTDATTYRLQVSTDSPFLTTIVDDSTITDTTYTVGPLDHNTTYYWRVNAHNVDWTTTYSPVWSYITTSAPTEYHLDQNYPNPFNPLTNIGYALPQATHVRITLYNLLGQQVLIIIDEDQKPGRYVVKCSASGLPSGVYFYRLTAGSFSAVKRMVVVR